MNHVNQPTMKPQLIDVDEAGMGRIVNPHKRTYEGINDPNYLPTLNKWEDFDQSVQSYPAPGLKPGRYSCCLVWQYQQTMGIRKGTWNTFLDQETVTESHAPCRQAYVIATPENKFEDDPRGVATFGREPVTYDTTDYKTFTPEKEEAKTAEWMFDNQTGTYWYEKCQIYVVQKGDAISIAKDYASQQTASKDAIIAEQAKRIGELSSALQDIADTCNGDNPDDELFWRIATTALTENNRTK